MSRKIIVANWKMNPQTQKDAEKILVGYGKQLTANSYKLKANVIICPPFVHLSFISKQLTANSHKLTAKLGAQDVFWENPSTALGTNEGAYTGEISPSMLNDIGVKYIIIGHSERRRYLGETDEMINKKVLAALKSGFNIILCVGEHHRENINEIPKVVEEQVSAALKGAQKPHIKKIIIAYEPVWAIGTGISDTPEDAMMAAVLIRKTAINVLGSAAKNLQVLYGGSVNAQNAGKFILHDGIDGVLVGGVSLDPKEFVGILRV